MRVTAPQPGLVIRCAYLWRAEADRGRDEGVKDRPCVVVLAVQRDGDALIVTVAPVTHSLPDLGIGAVEIPAATKRRLGLDDLRSWVVTTEVNRFVWPGPDLRPVARDRPGEFAYGPLPLVLFEQVKARIVEHVRAHRLRAVTRD